LVLGDHNVLKKGPIKDIINTLPSLDQVREKVLGNARLRWADNNGWTVSVWDGKWQLGGLF
jgi:hypothetical protein